MSSLTMSFEYKTNADEAIYTPEIGEKFEISFTKTRFQGTVLVVCTDRWVEDGTLGFTARAIESLDILAMGFS